MWMKTLSLRGARRKEGSRTGSAVLNYSLGRSRALVAVCSPPWRKKHISGWKVLTGFGKA